MNEIWGLIFGKAYFRGGGPYYQNFIAVKMPALVFVLRKRKSDTKIIQTLKHIPLVSVLTGFFCTCFS